MLAHYREFLPTLFGVSEVVLKPSSPQALESDGGLQVEVGKAEGTKCDRCWRYVPEVSQEPDRTGLCSRCVEALAEPVSL